jgi:hypothetical protein
VVFHPEPVDLALTQLCAGTDLKTNAIEALLAAEAGPTAALIVDLVMRHMDGVPALVSPFRQSLHPHSGANPTHAA